MWSFILTSFLVMAAQFDYNSPTPNAELVEQIKTLCTKTQGVTKIIVEGHTDARGSDKYNLRLSKQRAESVKSLLVSECGVRSDVITTVPMGKFFLIDNNNHDVNRRAVVHIVGVETVIIQDVIVQPSLDKSKEQKNNIVSVVGSNLSRELDVSSPSLYSKKVELRRELTPGVLYHRRIKDAWWLNGGVFGEGSLMFGVGYEF